jgi:ABC-type Fe3+ transport system permease subunit
MIGRLIGWVLFLAGLSVLVRDVLVSIEAKRWAPIALGQLWFDLDRSSLNLTQAIVQRYIHPFLWDPLIVSLLLCWAFAVLVLLGLLILTISSRRMRRRLPASRREC